MKRHPTMSLPLLSIMQAADILNVSTKTVRRLIKRGELRPHRIGRAVRLSTEDLSVYLLRIRS